MLAAELSQLRQLLTPIKMLSLGCKSHNYFNYIVRDDEVFWIWGRGGHLICYFLEQLGPPAPEPLAAGSRPRPKRTSHRESKLAFTSIQQWWDFVDRCEILALSKIRSFAAGFYRNLCRTELSSPEQHSLFLSGLSQVSAADNRELAAEVTWQELHESCHHETFWPIIGDLLCVVSDNLKSSRLPLNVVTLSPKKVDLQQLKNWRPFSLLCTEYKILSKALALRLRKVMAAILQPDQFS